MRRFFVSILDGFVISRIHLEQPFGFLERHGFKFFFGAAEYFCKLIESVILAYFFINGFKRKSTAEGDD